MPAYGMIMACTSYMVPLAFRRATISWPSMALAMASVRVMESFIVFLVLRWAELGECDVHMDGRVHVCVDMVDFVDSRSCGSSLRERKRARAVAIRASFDMAIS